MKKPSSCLEASNVIAIYNGIPVNMPITFRLNNGEFGILIGQNGSGKTSLLKVLTSQLKSYSGEVIVNSMIPRKNNLWKLIKSGIAYIPQFPELPGFVTVTKLIEIFRLENRTQRIVNNDFDIDKLFYRGGIKRNDFIGNLSFGQKRIVSISLAFIYKPSLLIADEPLAGLSNYVIGYIKERINSYISLGGSVLITAHGKQSELWSPNSVTEVISYRDIPVE